IATVMPVMAEVVPERNPSDYPQPFHLEGNLVLSRAFRMLNVLAIAGYRSLRDFVVPLRRLNLVTGANGSGKSNLYRALRLLAEVAQGRVIPSLAREGGLPSTLWAGPEDLSRAIRRGDQPVQGTPRRKPVSLRLGFAADD